MALQFKSNHKFAFPANDRESAWCGSLPQEKLCFSSLAHTKETKLSASEGQPKPKKWEEDGKLGLGGLGMEYGKLGAINKDGRMDLEGINSTFTVNNHGVSKKNDSGISNIHDQSLSQAQGLNENLRLGLTFSKSRKETMCETELNSKSDNSQSFEKFPSTAFNKKVEVVDLTGDINLDFNHQKPLFSNMDVCQHVNNIISGIAEPMMKKIYSKVSHATQTTEMNSLKGKLKFETISEGESQKFETGQFSTA